MTNYTAGIFFINGKNEILLTHATHSPIKYWGIPKGLVDANETFIEAAIREVREETGLCINTKAVNKVHCLGQMKYKTGNKTLVAFYCFLKDLSLKDLSLIDRTGKQSLNEVIQDNTIDTDKLWCQSTVTNSDRYKDPFPEVDAFKWFPLDIAQEVLYQPQKAIFPELLKIILDYNTNKS